MGFGKVSRIHFGLISALTSRPESDRLGLVVVRFAAVAASIVNPGIPRGGVPVAQRAANHPRLLIGDVRCQT